MPCKGSGIVKEVSSMSIEKIITEKITEDNPNIRDTEEKCEDVLIAELCDCITAMRSSKDNYAFKPVSSHRKIIGGAIVFLKRATRKLLKWYIEPICFQQTEFNNAVSAAAVREAFAIDMLDRRADSFDRILQRLIDENTELNKRVEMLEMALKKEDGISLS